MASSACPSTTRRSRDRPARTRRDRPSSCCPRRTAGTSGTRTSLRTFSPSAVFAEESVVARARDHVVAAGPPQPHERVGILDRDRREEQAVHHAEERRVGADAKRQRDDDDRGPALGLEEDADGVTKISDHRGTLVARRRRPRRPDLSGRAWTFRSGVMDHRRPPNNGTVRGTPDLKVGPTCGARFSRAPTAPCPVRSRRASRRRRCRRRATRR